MYIEVKKITEKSKKSSDDTTVKIPSTGNPLPGELEVLTEAIEIATIKSYRPWTRKTPIQKQFIDGEITVIYFKDVGRKKPVPQDGESKDNRRRSPNATMLIQESFRSFAKRMPTILLDNGED